MNLSFFFFNLFYNIWGAIIFENCKIFGAIAWYKTTFIFSLWDSTARLLNDWAHPRRHRSPMFVSIFQFRFSLFIHFAKLLLFETPQQGVSTAAKVIHTVAKLTWDRFVFLLLFFCSNLCFLILDFTLVRFSSLHHRFRSWFFDVLIL